MRRATRLSESGIIRTQAWIRQLCGCNKAFVQPHPPTENSSVSSSKMAVLHTLLSLTLFTLRIQLAHARTECAPELICYPQGRDCMTLIQKVPFAAEAPWRDLHSSRAFVEPQFLRDPFSPVRNPHPEDSMIQLPKIWRYSG